MSSTPSQQLKLPANVLSRHFIEHKYTYYQWLRDNDPVHFSRIAIMKVCYISRYEDCTALLRDPRFVRNRRTVTGGSRFPFPVPKSIKAIQENMVIADNPEHRRLRVLVQKAFSTHAVNQLSARIDTITLERLNVASEESLRNGSVDLMQAYCLPIPVTVIAEIMGIEPDSMPEYLASVKVLSKGMSGWNIIRTLLWDMKKLIAFTRNLINKKRDNPADDILSALIQAESEGDKLSEDELIGMVFLLIIAGYETTVHLINNVVITLLKHPAQLQKLRSDPTLIEAAIDEVLRFEGPIQGTKPCYAKEAVTLHGKTIPKGTMVIPLLGAANHDPAQFENAHEFNIERTANQHLGFGFGIHYCLGAMLAKLETKLAVQNLLQHSPNLRLAVAPDALELQRLPLWVRYKSLPVTLQ